MDLTLSDEQTMLVDSAERFVRDWTASSHDDPKALWRQFAEMGWLALPLPEDHGGLGGSMLDATLLLEAFGRGRLTTAYIGTVILGGGLVTALGNADQQADILPAIASGERQLALAHSERKPRGDANRLDTLAVAHDSGWRLDGTKVAVIGAAGADLFIVSARLGEETALFLVPTEIAGVTLAGYSMTGGGDAATLTLEGVMLPNTARLGEVDGSAALEAAADAAIAANCADAVGMMAALLDATATYANTREQFGKPLTANQSVRFKLADMAVALEEARSLALRAALMLGGTPPERIRAISGAKVGIGRGAKRVAELAIQLHGAMGVTEELTIGAYYKRILAFDSLFGSTDHHLVRHARASGRLAKQEA